MKKLTIKNCIMALAAIAGMNLATSCNGCSRKDDDMHDDDASTAFHDTVYIDTCMSPVDSLIRDKATGTYVPYGKAASTSNSSSAGSNNTKPGNTGGRQLTQEEIDNRIENSSSQSLKNGKPANSGGTSGSGQGTGTGSTGNNSRVTTKEDQLRN